MSCDGLLALTACVLCVIALPFSLSNEDSTKLEAVCFVACAIIFGAYAWMCTSAEFRESLKAYINLF